MRMKALLMIMLNKGQEQVRQYYFKW
jgi:hypothetical protein